MPARTYLLRTFLYALLAGCLVAGVNYAVDPYGITGATRIPGFNQYKVEINEHTWVMKKYQPLSVSHNALIVGNSRVELAIRPTHDCFLHNGMEVYNLGIPGAGLRTQLEYALNLVYQQPIKTVFLSIDFTDFISSQQQPRTDGSSSMAEQSTGEFRFAASGERNPEYRWVVLRDYFKSLLSLDALVASIKTIALQSSSSADRDDAGFNPARDFAAAVDVEGPHALFAQKMASLEAKYSLPWYFRDAQGQPNHAVAELTEFLDIAAAQGIKVILFTNPFHDSFWELLRSQGHMPAYDDWMQEMENLLRKRQGGTVEFWDFSQDSAYIHEPVPAAGVRSGPLQWFWEPAHYRQELGDLMVDAMLSDSCATDIAFGRRVF
ncbi:MAG: hypothetical protein IPG64_04465 [Haliea sp.]|nr:hypothetical protein [Haliea sp.]